MKTKIILHETLRHAAYWAMERGFKPADCLYVTPQMIRSDGGEKLRGFRAKEFHNPVRMSLSYDEVILIARCFRVDPVKWAKRQRNLVLQSSIDLDKL